MSPVSHLLGSTVFAAAVWLATLALRRNHARARHGLWMAASVKFLIPFSLFVSLGSQVTRPPAAPAPAPRMRFVMVDGAPSTSLIGGSASSAGPSRRDWTPSILMFVWIAGGALILIRWGVRWRRASAHLRASSPWKVAASLPVEIRSSASATEPGVFGILRPVVVLPAGIEERLSAEQLQAIFAHELSHVRHYDNLAAAIHMLVEAVFWFHPLVWWIGARLVEERERACDEDVLECGSDRAVYAESIVRVCQFCLESPLPCISGITGADLKQRIRYILSGNIGPKLEPGKKLLLAAMGAAALAAPFTMGLLHPAKMRAQTPQVAAPLHFEAASMKPTNDGILWTRPQRTKGRFRWTTQLMYLLGYAYNMEWWRISEPPGTGGAIYDLEATTSPNASEAQVRLMLQTLLLERFHMVVHRVTKNSVEGYSLTVAKDGAKLEEAKAVQESDTAAESDEWVAATSPRQYVGVINGHRATMLQLVATLQRLLQTAVLDQTGLAGKYNFSVEFARNDDPQDFTGVVDSVKKLGLKLERYKGPVEFLVIDRMGQFTEN